MLAPCSSLFDPFAKLSPFFSQYSIQLRDRTLTEMEILLHLFLSFCRERDKYTIMFKAKLFFNYLQLYLLSLISTLL